MIASIEGKIASVVGGASRGYGPGSAIALARHGAAAVMIADLSRSGWSQPLAEIERMGCRVRFYEVDLDEESAVKDAISRMIEAEQRIDIAHNHLDPGPEAKSISLFDLDLDAWHKGLAQGMRRIWLWMKHEIRAPGAPVSAIVNAVSELGQRGRPGNVLRCTNEHAIAAMTEAAAKGHVNEGIRINLVSTSSVVFNKDAKNAINRTADAMVWLSSDEARLVNGQTLVIDGAVVRW